MQVESLIVLVYTSTPTVPIHLFEHVPRWSQTKDLPNDAAHAAAHTRPSLHFMPVAADPKQPHTAS